MSGTYLDLMTAIRNGDSKTALKMIADGNYKILNYKNSDNALIRACKFKLDDVALKLIETEDVGHVGENGDTALIMACYKKMTKVALKLIETGKAKPEHFNKFKRTALIYCVNDEKKTMEKVALKLIETGKANEEQPDKEDGKTALIWACRNKHEKIALALIATGKSKPEHVTNSTNRFTALIYACKNNLEKVALALLKTGKARPEQVTKKGWTALMYACDDSNMSEISLALIATGKSKPEQVGDSGETALINACFNKFSNVALALLKTGKARPEAIYEERTALIYACKNKMTEVALKILDNCNSKPSQYPVQDDGYTALYWVNKNHLPKQLKERLEEMLVKCKTHKTLKVQQTKKRKMPAQRSTKKRHLS
jgi:ankyrin repeat protein